jgi:hypothetical protein
MEVTTFVEDEEEIAEGDLVTIKVGHYTLFNLLTILAK